MSLKRAMKKNIYSRLELTSPRRCSMFAEFSPCSNICFQDKTPAEASCPLALVGAHSWRGGRRREAHGWSRMGLHVAEPVGFSPSLSLGTKSPAVGEQAPLRAWATDSASPALVRKRNEVEFPLWLRGLRTQLVSMRMSIQSLAWLSRLRIWHCCSCGVGQWLQLWFSP